MKTTMKAATPYAAVTLDELVFSNRNQAYGAYNLRKKYKSRLFAGFLFAAFAFGTVVSVPLIRAYFVKPDEKPITIDRGPIIIDRYDEPIPEVPKIKEPQIAPQVRFVPPVVVDSTDQEMDLESLTEGMNNGDNLMPDSNIIAYVPENIAIPREEEEVPVDFVEENATFQGGELRDFQIWVQKNITYPAEAATNEISGRVNIRFSVNKKGKVCDVEITRGVHKTLDDAAIQAVLSSPQWMPAKQNGSPVKQRFSMQVVFKLQ